MVDYISESKQFERNLRERFFLEKQLEILPAYMRGTKKATSDQGTYKENILNDLFVERLLQDPYFSIHICKEIEESDFDLKNVFAYIQYVVLEQYLHKSNLIRKKNVFCQLPLSGSNDAIIDLIKSFDEKDSGNELKYNDFFSSVINCDNEELIDAIKEIPTKKEKLNVRWQDDSPFSWCGIYDFYSQRLKNVSESRTEYSHRVQVIEQRNILKFLKTSDFRDETRFLHENIKTYFRYSIGADKRYLKVPFIAFLNFNNQFLIDVKNTLSDYGFMDSQNDYDIAEHLKFFMDAVFICQFSWFNTLDMEEKIEILNHYYDTLDISIKESNLNLCGKNSMLHVLAYNEARKLYEKKDYENAVALLNTIFNSTNKKSVKYYCASFIADIYQEKNEYEASLDWFINAYNISKKFNNRFKLPISLENVLSHVTRSDRLYRRNDFNLIQYIELLNIAGMNCYLGDQNKADEYLKLLNDEIQVFSVPKQMMIYNHLADFCSKHQKVLEYYFLMKVLEKSEKFDICAIEEIGNDIQGGIFSFLKYQNNNKSKKKSFQYWVDKRKKNAFELSNEFEKHISTSQLSSSLIKVYKNYNQSLHYDPKKVDQVELIIDRSNIASKLYDIHSIFSSTLEPRRLINKIKFIIMDLDKIEGIEKQKYHDLSYNDLIERLNLEMARCHYTLENFDAAEDILREIIATSKEKDILFNSYCLLGISLIKLRDERSGIRNLEKAIEMDLRDDFVFNYIRDELAFSPEIMCRVSEAIADRINMKLHNEVDSQKDGYLLAVREFNEFGLTTASMHFIEKGLQDNDNQILKMYLLEEMAYISYLDSDYDKTKEILEEIVNIVVKAKNIDNIKSPEYDWCHASALHKLSLIYAKRRDFKEASDVIDWAIETLSTSMKDFDDLSKINNWDGLKNIYSFFANDSLLLNKINNRQVVETLETAECIFFDVSSQNKHKNFDYSLALVEYGKGIETLMHDFISVKLRNKVFSNQPEPVNNKYWYGKEEEEIKSLPPELRNVLGLEERTITLGQWKPLILEVFYTDIEKIQNPYVRDSYEFLEGFMNKSEWYTIIEACAKLSNYRNGAAHYGKKEFKDIIPERKEIVVEVNNVISVFNSLENNCT